jgi:hypothetical protein
MSYQPWVYHSFMSFVSNRLDYRMSASYFDVSEVPRMQTPSCPPGTQSTHWRDCFSPVCRSVHWLQVQWRIKYELAVLMLWSLSGLFKSYLANDHQLIVGIISCSLRLHFHACLCSVHSLWDMSFSVTIITVWNCLLLTILIYTNFFGFSLHLTNVFFAEETATCNWQLDTACQRSPHSAKTKSQIWNWGL